MAKGFQETTIFCKFLSCHISVKWPTLQTVFKAGSQVYRQHLGSHSPLLSPNSLLTLNSNVMCLHDETLLFLCTHQWCRPYYLLLSRAVTGMLLPLQHRGSWGVPKTFPHFSLSFFASFHPRGCKWEDLQTHTQFYSVVSRTPVSCAIHAQWAGALMVLQHCSACVTTAREGWTTQVNPTNPEKIGYSVMVWLFNSRRNQEMSKLYLLFQYRFSSDSHYFCSLVLSFSSLSS